MYEKQVEVKLKLGLQARQAALFVQEANRYAAEVFLQRDNKKVNAKSIMGVMSLAIAKGTNVTLSGEGKDIEEALEALANIMLKDE